MHEYMGQGSERQVIIVYINNRINFGGVLNA